MASIVSNVWGFRFGALLREALSSLYKTEKKRKQGISIRCMSCVRNLLVFGCILGNSSSGPVRQHIPWPSRSGWILAHKSCLTYGCRVLEFGLSRFVVACFHFLISTIVFFSISHVFDTLGGWNTLSLV